MGKQPPPAWRDMTDRDFALAVLLRRPAMPLWWPQEARQAIVQMIAERREASERLFRRAPLSSPQEQK